MKTFELNRNSWHYKAASFWHDGLWNETNICAYARYVLFGSLLIAFLSCVVLGLGGSIGYGLASAAWALITGGEFTELAKASLVVLTIVVALILGSLGYKFAYDKASHISEQENPGFAVLLYRKFKDKTCAKIVFK